MTLPLSARRRRGESMLRVAGGAALVRLQPRCSFRLAQILAKTSLLSSLTAFDCEECCQLSGPQCFNGALRPTTRVCSVQPGALRRLPAAAHHAAAAAHHARRRGQHLGQHAGARQRRGVFGRHCWILASHRKTQCNNQIVGTRVRHGSITTFTPSTRRQLNGVAV